MSISITKTDKILYLLLILNTVCFIFHLYLNYQDIYYFFQLTIIGQLLTLINFTLSIILHQKKSSKNTKLLLSRLHLVTISLELIIVIGYWSLFIFFNKGIIRQGEQMSVWQQIMSVWVHGGSFSTLFYFIKADQIVMQRQKWRKYAIHLCWGVPFVILQCIKWKMTGIHIYGFLQHLTWPQIIAFQLILYFMAVLFDYVLTIRHGLNLTIKHLGGQKEKLEDLEKIKQEQDRNKYQNQQKLAKQKQLKGQKQNQKYKQKEVKKQKSKKKSS